MDDNNNFIRITIKSGNNYRTHINRILSTCVISKAGKRVCKREAYPV
jgi:hypothetical protein